MGQDNPPSYGRKACPCGLSLLLGEEDLESTAVAPVERCVDERVEEGVGIAQPQEDALPDGRDVPGAQGTDELRDKEREPAEHKHSDEDAHHEGRLLLLLLPPCVPFCLEGDGGMADCEHHLGMLCGILHLQGTNRHAVRKCHFTLASYGWAWAPQTIPKEVFGALLGNLAN